MGDTMPADADVGEVLAEAQGCHAGARPASRRMYEPLHIRAVAYTKRRSP